MARQAGAACANSPSDMMEWAEAEVQQMVDDLACQKEYVL